MEQPWTPSTYVAFLREAFSESEAERGGRLAQNIKWGQIRAKQFDDPNYEELYTALAGKDISEVQTAYLAEIDLKDESSSGHDKVAGSAEFLAFAQGLDAVEEFENPMRIGVYRYGPPWTVAFAFDHRQEGSYGITVKCAHIESSVAGCWRSRIGDSDIRQMHRRLPLQ